MTDFIVDTIFWFVVIWLAMKVWEKYLTAKNEALVEQIKDMQAQMKNSIIQVEIEKHEGMFYLFEKDTHQFIAQGSNFDEVREHCKTRFKDRAVVANEEQMEQLGLK
jgi:hypothetical protein